MVRVAERPAGWLRGAHRVILLVYGYNKQPVRVLRGVPAVSGSPSVRHRAGRAFLLAGRRRLRFLPMARFLELAHGDSRRQKFSLMTVIALAPRACKRSKFNRRMVVLVTFGEVLS
ncbi:protein of unknown function [Methylococcus capsulatus]|uniref:Uncharacterized protein n=1 Tax=Methylococcus capsulatus TaxID=414 RepID=A0AA35XSZ2_METCP|nr:protein of unknown function [Methylococcus capsulatus]